MKALVNFELVVIRPIEGKRGELMFYRTVAAENVTSAVAKVRQEVSGSGLVVLQSASYHQGELSNPVVINRLAEAYDRHVAS